MAEAAILKNRKIAIWRPQF